MLRFITSRKIHQTILIPINRLVLKNLELALCLSPPFMIYRPLHLHAHLLSLPLFFNIYIYTASKKQKKHRSCEHTTPPLPPALPTPQYAYIAGIFHSL